MSRAIQLFFVIAKFSGKKPASKNGKIFFFTLLNKKIEFILSSKTKCPKSVFYWLMTQ